MQQGDGCSQVLRVLLGVACEQGSRRAPSRVGLAGLGKDVTVSEDGSTLWDEAAT